jgi:asparagine synthetase B (glutamine-hydrolysing)
MCGICSHTQDPTGVVVRAMNAEIVRRGPDDEGVHVDREAGIGIGARRLTSTPFPDGRGGRGSTDPACTGMHSGTWRRPVKTGRAHDGLARPATSCVWLPDRVLAKADRATMLTLLEMRMPFLHREVAEFAARLPVELHLGNGGKALLRRLLADLIGPNFGRRAKPAFRVPVSEWLRGPLARALLEQVPAGSLYRDACFDRDRAAAMLDAHLRGQERADVPWPSSRWDLETRRG